MFETVEIYNGRQLTFLRMNYAQGKAYLQRLGWTFNDSPYHMGNGSQIAHYQSVCKYWIIRES